MTGYRFISEHCDAYPVVRICRVVGINRSGFYKWNDRALSQRNQVDAELLVEITEIYKASRGTYGSPRIWGQLTRRGINVGRKRVARLMRHADLIGVHTRRKWRRGRPDVAPAPDLVQRDFTADAPDRVWVADITEFVTREGKLFLAGIVDVATSQIVGWSMQNRQTSDLVVDALVAAALRRNITGDLVHHSDRGSQYMSLAFTNRLEDLDLVPSFGSTGDCYDNAKMEAFWATLKREIVWITGVETFDTRAELRAVIFDYIEVFYNNQRHQAGLGHLTPNEYEHKITAA